MFSLQCLVSGFLVVQEGSFSLWMCHLFAVSRPTLVSCTQTETYKILDSGRFTKDVLA